MHGRFISHAAEYFASKDEWIVIRDLRDVDDADAVRINDDSAPSAWSGVVDSFDSRDIDFHPGEFHYGDMHMLDCFYRWSVFCMYWPQLMSCALVGRE